MDHSRPTIIVLAALISIVVLSLGFYSNKWNIAEQQFFENHTYPMEGHVIARLVKSDQDGILSSGGLLGLGGLDDTPIDWSNPNARQQFLAYENGISFETYSTYPSQIGAQGMVFSLLDRLITATTQTKLSVYQIGTSIVFAVILTGVILWFHFEIGWLTALVVFASIVFSQWITVFGGKLFWSMWAFYLPMLTIMYFLRWNQSLPESNLLKLGSLAFAGMFIKTLFNGYEYITTTMIMMFVPIVYYGVKEKWTRSSWAKTILLVGLCASLAILLSLVTLSLQIATVEGSLVDGYEHILFSLRKRTYADPNVFPSNLGLESKLSTVLMIYLKGIYLDLSNFISIPYEFVRRYILRIRYIELVAIFVISSLLLHFHQRKLTSNKQTRSSALVAATWFSITAPLSWFVIFKSHSFIHDHMNHIAWHMPFVLFGFATVGCCLQEFIPLRLLSSRKGGQH